MNLFKRQTRKALLELTANQAQEIKERDDMIEEFMGEITRLRLDCMFLHRENRKLRVRAEAMTPIKERMGECEKKK